jgi:hypothetical protein
VTFGAAQPPCGFCKCFICLQTYVTSIVS